MTLNPGSDPGLPLCPFGVCVWGGGIIPEVLVPGV